VSALSKEMQDALLLLHEHGPLDCSTGRREHQAGWRFIRPGTAYALEKRGLAFVRGGGVYLSDLGRQEAQRLAEERARERARQEEERLAARAAGLPPAPKLRLVRGEVL
jgi:hypothetical protein